MSSERDRSHPTDAFGLPEGLLAAIVAALLLVGTFAIASGATPMPPSEYWAALTTFSILAVGMTLPGCAALYDALGQTVRRDWRALAALASLLPALYLAYAFAVRELSGDDLNVAIAFTAIPALAFGGTQGSRQPHILDAVAIGYLLISLSFAGLLPPLTLPQQGGLVGFFQLAVVPLLLLLYAGRGWPGLGYTWHLSGRELLEALVAGIVGAGAIATLARLLGDGGLGPGTNLFVRVVSLYFFVALPAELLLRGGAQNGLARALRGRMGGRGGIVTAIAGATALTALGCYVLGAGRPASALDGIVLGLVAGWTYLQTGKVTASAVTTTIALLPAVLRI